MAQGPRKLNSETQANTDAIVSGSLSGSTRHEARRAQQLWKHLRGKSHQLLISREQHGRFSARQSQIEAVVNRVIQMTRESQCLHLKVTVGFDVIHERSGPAEALLQALELQLTSSLQPPESIGHFGEHQLRRQNQFSLENRLLEAAACEKSLR